MRITCLLLALTGCSSLELLDSLSSAANEQVTKTTDPYVVTEWVDRANDCGHPSMPAVIDDYPIVCNIAPAIERIQKHCKENYKRMWPNMNRISCSIRVPKGPFELLTPAKFCTPIDIRGAGGSFNAAQTVIRTPCGQDALVFYTKGQDCPGGEWGSGGSVVEDIAVAAYNRCTGTSSSALSAGVRIRTAQMIVRNVWANGYVNGFRLEGEFNLGRNADLNTLDNIDATNSKHAGLYIDGGAANTGLIVAYNGVHNCQDGEAWNKHPEMRSAGCSDIAELSFLGNTFIATHAANAKDKKTGTTFPGYRVESNSGLAVWLNPYTEGPGTPASTSQYSTLVLGGLTKWEGNGWHMRLGQLNRLRVVGENGYELRAGDFTKQNFVELRKTGDRFPMRVRWDERTKSYIQDIANVRGGASLKFPTE